MSEQRPDSRIETTFDPLDNTKPLLDVSDLTAEFQADDERIKAVEDVSFTVESEIVFGIVGESGSGKSTIAESVMNMLPSSGRVTNGSIEYRGENVLQMDRKREESFHGGEVAMIFQDPMSHLNPVYTIGEQIADVIVTHTDLSDSAARDRAISLLEDVGIPAPEERIDDYPHEYSGGMRQRALIAMALACDPSLIIADEPTTALDVTIQAQILDLIDDLIDEYQTSWVFITHNLGIIAQIADKVMVLYAGNVMEQGSARDIFNYPTHPYTEQLLESIPSRDSPPGSKEFTWIEGSPPDPANRPEGCVFRSRCAHATEECKHNPPMHEPRAGHEALCHYPLVEDHE